MQENRNKPINRAWYRALIVLVALSALGIITAFVFIKLLPSEVQIQIKKAGVTISILGGVGVFIVLFKLYYRAYKKIVAFLISLTSIIAFYMITRRSPEDISGTISGVKKAERYLAQQMSETDIILQNPEFQKLIASKEFQKLVTSEEFQKFLTSEELAKVQTPEEFEQLTAKEEFAELMAKEEFAKLVGREEFVTLIASRDFREALARENFFSDLGELRTVR